MFYGAPHFWGRGNSGAQAILFAPALIMSDGLGYKAKPIANKLNENEVVQAKQRKRSVVHLQSGVAACSKALQRFI